MSVRASLSTVLDTAPMGDLPFDRRIERVQDTRILLRSKRTLLCGRTMWRWTIEWSGVGRRKSPRWSPTREQAEADAFEAWARWWRERSGDRAGERT
jgi:hypothetical protein